MRFHPPLVFGRFLRRYKRFFVDVRLDDGHEVAAHCPNTGSLLGCLVSGARVGLAPAEGVHRKLAWTWKLVDVGSAWVGVDTGMAVPLVREAFESGLLPELGGFERVIPEVAYGVAGGSRIDLLLSRGGQPQALPPGTRRAARQAWQGDERVYVEVKNTTLILDGEGGRLGAFPDAVTSRGLKHLQELVHVRSQGHRAAMVYCVQRSDCEAFGAAATIDPAYAAGLQEARAAGVEVYALGADVSPQEVTLRRRLNFAPGS